MIAALLTTILRVHRTWAWVVIFGNAFVGIWGVAAQWAERLRGRPFWGAVVAAHGLIAVQVALGTYLFSQGVRASNFHVFYGALLVIAPTLVWVYRSEPAVRRHVFVFYGGAHLFFMGLAIRAYLQA